MNLIIKPMKKIEAMQILKWKYEEPYSIYNMEGSEEELKELLGGSYYTARNEMNEIVGYFCFGNSARVPAGEQYGVYEESAIDMGLGMRPDLTGQGNGAEFVKDGFRFAIEKFKSNNIRLTVANFNKRAIRAYKKIGFKTYKTFQRKTEKSNTEFITMIYKGNGGEEVCQLRK